MRSHGWAAWSIGVLAALVYSLYGWFQWARLTVPSWDLGIFSQLAKAYATFSTPIVPIKGEGFHLLGDHFHPLLVVLGPLWRIWPSPLALLILQAVLFGLSAVPLTRLAAEKWGAAVGSCFGLAYAFSWGLQSAVVAQFHEIAFAVPLLALSLTSFLRGRLRSAVLWAGLLVFVKEDLGLTSALLGAIIVFRGDNATRSRLWGAALMVWSAAWTVISTVWIMPALNPRGQYDYTDKLGGLMDVFIPLEKWETVGLLIAVAGIVGLRSWLMGLMLPTLAWRFVGDVEFYWGWRWHYSAVLMPIAFAALLEVIDRWPRVRLLAIGASLATTLLITSQQSVFEILDPDFREAASRWDVAQQAMAAIPGGATVESDLQLLAYLVPGHTVYWLGNTNPAPDYHVVHEPSFEEGDDEELAARLREKYGADYDIAFKDEGYIVYRRAG